MAKVKIKELTADILSDFLAEHELDLYNVEYVKEGRDWFLRVYIDKLSEEEYVSTDDCETVSRYLSEKLDDIDPIEQNYYLEVCSPGMDRQLMKEADYERFAGRMVDVSLYKAFDGKKNYSEVKLIGLKDGLLILEQGLTGGKKGPAGTDKTSMLEIPFEQVSKVKLSIIF